MTTLEERLVRAVADAVTSLGLKLGHDGPLHEDHGSSYEAGRRRFVAITPVDPASCCGASWEVKVTPAADGWQ
ncbi:hypothetical protein [Castellaniella sp. UC4442_H9]